MKNNTKNIRKGITAILFAVIILFGALQGVSAVVECCYCIDIKPGSCPNSINTNSHGVIPVAILTGCFDAADVDPETVEFAGASPVHYALEDVDGDGDLDLILHFRTQETDIEIGDTEATLMGYTYDGCFFSATGYGLKVKK